MVLTAFLFSFSLTANAVKDDKGTDGDFTWLELDDGTVAVTSYTGPDTELTIPNTLDGKTVTLVGDPGADGSFSGENFTSVTIPDGVTEIAGGAFSNCKSLTKVTLSNNVKYIDFKAFYGCNSLKEIALPSTLETIGERAFADTGLVSVVIPQKVTYIGPEAFAGCSNLTKVSVLNNTVEFDEDTSFPTPGYDGKIFASSPLTYGIFGNKGSTAETYANANNIKFQLLSTDTEIKDTTLGVVVSGSLPDGASLKASKISADSETYNKAQQAVGNDKVLFMFDLSLIQNGVEVQPNGDVRVTITIPDEYKNVENLVIAYIADDGKIIYIDSSIENGKISFTTNHFSLYAIVQQVEVPKTGDQNNDVILWTSILLFTFISTLLLTGNRKKMQREF